MRSSNECTSRRRPSAPSESARRLMERRRRRARNGGGRGGSERIICCRAGPRSGSKNREGNGCGRIAAAVFLSAVYCIGVTLGLYRVYHIVDWDASADWQGKMTWASNPHKGTGVDGERTGMEREQSFEKEQRGQGEGAAEENAEMLAKAAREREHWKVHKGLQQDPPAAIPAHRGPEEGQQVINSVQDVDGREPVAAGSEKRPNPSAYHDPADDVTLAYGDAGGAGAGPIEMFLRGGKLPILLLTCTRAELLRQTIESLRNVRGMDMTQVLVLQDGTDESVKKVVEKERLYLHQNTKKPRLRGNDGAARIAMHYKYALDHVFEKAQEAPGVIVVEDDLLFSPDFLEYFEVNAPILERDETTLVLSAWNDNGYKGKVLDKAELQRTTFFPGLGWLLPKKLYDELRPNWPRDHWDHWLRDSEQHKGRECVIPEVPRTFHNGIKGTFMDQQTHDRLFKNIDYNTDASFSWIEAAKATADWHTVGPPTYARAMSKNYELRMRARIAAARHIDDLNDYSGADSGREDIVFWYNMPQTENPTGAGPSPFQPLADFFGLWHEHKRAEHCGMHIFRQGGESGAHVMLINSAKPCYVDLMPPDMIPPTAQQLRHVGGAVRGRQGLGDAEAMRKKASMRVLAAEAFDLSCTDLCSAQDLTCDDGMFGHLNACSSLRANFPCGECAMSVGPDQPCYVSPNASDINSGKCLVSANPSNSRCSASHAHTRRLCPCMPTR